MSDSPLLVFGLGNPGPEYANTYHNAGLLALLGLEAVLEAGSHAEISSPARASFWYRKYPQLILCGSVPHPDNPHSGDPELYMNESGTAVQEALAFFKVPAKSLVVLNDDSDLGIGEWKLDFGRGAAGHHGVESVIAMLGTQDFARGRIGIRPAEREDAPRLKAGDFVLRPIREEDKAPLQRAASELAKKLMENI